MSRKIDMSGGRYGRLTVIKEAGRKRKEVLWECRCDCGRIAHVSGYYLRSGHTKSCGCLIPETSKKVNVTHGLYKTRLHCIYTNMKTRCYNPNYYLYHRYGGRGIAICDDWLGENGLHNFAEWSMKNGYSENLSIDRIDNDKGYSPENCRWVTMKQQQNNRSTNHIIPIDGVSKTMAEWAVYINVNYRVMQKHVRDGDVIDFLKAVV